MWQSFHFPQDSRGPLEQAVGVSSVCTRWLKCPGLCSEGHCWPHSHKHLVEGDLWGYHRFTPGFACQEFTWGGGDHRMGGESGK